MNKKILKLAQILASLGLLTLVAFQVGLLSETGRAEFIKVLVGANMSWLALSVMVGILINMSSALKWYMLVRARELATGYWRIFSYYLIGQFYNLLLPTSVGGDVVRSYQLGKFTGRQADALASVFVERYSGVVVLLLLSGLAVISQLAVFNVAFVLGSLIAFTLGLGFILWMILDHRLYHRVRDHAVQILPASAAVFTKIDKLLASIDVYKDERAALVWAFINSLVFYFIAVLNVYVTARVFQLDVSFVDILVATPIIMLIMNIPLSVGNLGLMEFAYINVFQLMGYSPALGLSVAVLMRVKSLLDGAMGGLLHPIFVIRDEQAAVSTEAANRD